MAPSEAHKPRAPRHPGSPRKLSETAHANSSTGLANVNVDARLDAGSGPGPEPEDRSPVPRPARYTYACQCSVRRHCTGRLVSSKPDPPVGGTHDTPNSRRASLGKPQKLAKSPNTYGAAHAAAAAQLQGPTARLGRKPEGPSA